ncbi:MAG: endonuclease/exonuclease/phosphatase family protein [Phycisphaerales bacterium]
MRRNRLSVLAGIASSAVLALSATAHAQLRVVNYNLAKLAGDAASIRATLAAIGDDNKFGFATDPAVMCFQEIRAADIAALDAHILAAFPGTPYARGTFTTSGTEDGAAGAQAMYYRTDLLTEVVAGHVDIATGASRNSDRWLLQLNGYTSTAARFYVYSSHLKASNTAADAAERNTGAIALRNNVVSLGASAHCILVGDYNLYTNTEAAYQTLAAAGVGQCVDPLGSANWTGAANAIMHTQSPRDVTGTLIGGGVDDRFDFQLSTADFHDGDGLSIIAGTYRTFGNDGAHYNLAINSGNNSYYPGDLVRSNAVADLLFAASDHMPVVADYQVPPVMTASMPSTFATVIAGATVVVPVAVSNTANVIHPLGTDALVATVAGSAGLVGSQTVTAALAPASTTVNLQVNTAAAANINGSALITTAVEGAQNASITRTIAGTVLGHARPSFSQKTLQASATVASSTAANAGLVSITVPVANFGFNGLQARLDIDGVSGLTAPFAVVDGTQANVAATPTGLVFSFDSNGRAPGVYTQVATIATSDENLAGATSGSLALTLSVTVTAAGNPADLDGDGSVGGSDLSILLNQWGGVGTADLDGDGTVGGGDLAILLNAWG